MEIKSAIAEILINFSNQYPLLSGILIILFVLRPVSKLGTSFFHSKVEKKSYTWNTKLVKIIKSKWYLRLLAWLIDTIFSIKLISEKEKIKKD